MVRAARPVAVTGGRRTVVRVRVRRTIAAGRVHTALGRCRGRQQPRRRLGAVRGRVDRAVREDGRRARQTVGRRERRDGRARGPVQRARGAPENSGPTTSGRPKTRRRTFAQRRRPRGHGVGKRRRRFLRRRGRRHYYYYYYYHHRNCYLLGDIRRRTNTVGPLRPQTQTAVGRGRVLSELTSPSRSSSPSATVDGRARRTSYRVMLFFFLFFFLLLSLGIAI